ncbi:MFS transporter [Breznakiella homolactica]|uniref:MFS transporter n=1 Tax=Breznakiella homolactica TaxID=2798577 RepID=A0A7T7XN08_9SPIR|nr:MFS transporter [Breznakiella homolactica]QQO09296.1 MFS transporter [Breznakiella homolactica]
MDKNQASGVLDPAKQKKLYFLCWVSYFASNLGRLSYTVSMVEIIRTENITGAQAGFIGTGFFIAYGICQLFSGYLGDRVHPRRMVSVGLLASGVLNFAMIFGNTMPWLFTVWCANGIFQSMLWPPIARMVAEYYSPERRKTVLVGLGTTYPIAMLSAYVLSGLLVWLSGWRSVFLFFSVLITAAAVLWIIGLKNYPAPAGKVHPARPQNAVTSGRTLWKGTWKPLIAASILFCGALVFQGFLRDGLVNWVPVFLKRNFAVSSAFAILSTTVLPLVNLAGIYVTNRIYKAFKNEALTSLILFGTAAAAALVLRIWGQHYYGATLALFALVTACMMGINLMLASFVPSYFSSLGKVSMVSGIMNATVYVGSSLATYTIGMLTDHYGWNTSLNLIVLMASLGVVCCMISLPFWRRVS